MSFTRRTPAFGAAYTGPITSVNTLSITGGIVLNAGDLVVVAVSWEDNAASPTISDSAGNTYTALTKVQAGASATKWHQLFYCLSATANAFCSWTATLGAASSYAQIAALAYLPGGTVSFVAQGTGQSGSASATQTTSAFTAGTVAVALMGEFSGTSATAGSGWTEQWDNGSNGSHGFDRIDAPGGTIIGNCTTPGNVDWGMVAASFTDSGAVVPTISGTSAAAPRRNSLLYIFGNNFGATQGTGGVTIGGATESVQSWSNTLITVLVAIGTNKYGATVNAIVTDGLGNVSSGFALTGFLPPVGSDYVNAGTPNPTATNRLTFTADAASGDQAEWTVRDGASVFTVDTDLTFSATGYGTFSARLWVPTDGYGAAADQVLDPPLPVLTLPGVSTFGSTTARPQVTITY